MFDHSEQNSYLSIKNLISLSLCIFEYRFNDEMMRRGGEKRVDMCRIFWNFFKIKPTILSLYFLDRIRTKNNNRLFFVFKFSTYSLILIRSKREKRRENENLNKMTRTRNHFIFNFQYPLFHKYNSEDSLVGGRGRRLFFFYLT